MNGPAVFLAARLDDDEAESWNVHTGDCRSAGPLQLSCDCGYPARALREVQAKRTLLRYFTDPATGEPVSLAVAMTPEELGRRGGTYLPGSWIIRELDAVYSDHPDYQPEWKP